MEHVAVAVPHLGVLQSFALLLDFLDRRQRRRQICHGDDAATACVVEARRRDLPRRIAAEHRGLTKFATQTPQPFPDRLVELPNRVIPVVFRRCIGRFGPLDVLERLDGLPRERRERNLERTRTMRETRRIRRHEPRMVERRRPTHSVQQVGGQREMQHLLDEDRGDDVGDFLIPARPQRIQRTEIRRNRGVLELDGPLEMHAEVGQGRHGHVTRNDSGR